MEPWLTEPLGDMTAVAVLLCDPHFTVERIEARETATRPANRQLCEWTLRVTGYTPADVGTLLRGIRRQKREAGEPGFALKCPSCGMDWVASGDCSEDCGGGWPDPYRFDASKRGVIAEKCKVQNMAANITDERAGTDEH